MAVRRKKRTTLQDVAERAGVSLKTASNVKNDWPYVSEETRRKVQRAMTELEYRPCRVAESLVTGRSETIGVVVPDVCNPFFSTGFRGCEDELAARGYSACLCNTDESLDRETYYLELLVDQGVDGLVLWGSCAGADDLVRNIGETVPVVSVDGLARRGTADFTYIAVDNRQGAEQITRHLVGRGLRRIAYLAGASSRAPAQDRLAGYTRALEKAGLSVEEHLVAEGSPSIGGGYAAALDLLSRLKPDALFCYNDLMAIGAIAAAQELGLDVPGDLAVVGFDDIVPASLVTPLLTTVRIPQYELGRQAVSMLFERLENPALPARTVNCPVELIVRESCGARRMSLQEKRDLLRNIAVSAETSLPGRSGNGFAGEGQAERQRAQS
jgi:LacI family transcriptional regulator